MKRRSFLAGLLLAPLVKYLPTPKPVPKLEPWQDQTSIWLCNWGENRVYSMMPGDCLYFMDRPVNPNWLKRELNK